MAAFGKGAVGKEVFDKGAYGKEERSEDRSAVLTTSEEVLSFFPAVRPPCR
jgi:hypothetical protein